MHLHWCLSGGNIRLLVRQHCSVFFFFHGVLACKTHTRTHTKAIPTGSLLFNSSTHLFHPNHLFPVVRSWYLTLRVLFQCQFILPSVGSCWTLPRLVIIIIIISCNLRLNFDTYMCVHDELTILYNCV